jgi:hypothetical protein
VGDDPGGSARPGAPESGAPWSEAAHVHVAPCTSQS